MSNYWIRSNGQNTLKGVEGDPENPPVLPDHLILEFLSDGNQKARDDFNALLPSMSDLERERLSTLFAFSTKPQKYVQEIEDGFQSSMNNLLVRSSNQRLPHAKSNTSTSTSKLIVRL